eukprot:4254257-Pleurochrysis_carterae.AAC.1
MRQQHATLQESLRPRHSAQLCTATRNSSVASGKTGLDSSYPALIAVAVIEHPTAKKCFHLRATADP